MENNLLPRRAHGWRLFVLLFSVTTLPLSYAQNRLPVRLPAAAKGSAAINALGSQLPAVARAYRLDPQRLAEFLQTQPSLGVDRDGLLLFICEAPRLRPLAGSPANTTDISGVTAAALSPESTDATRLHSFPGAQRVIFLDFDGHTTSGTAWNSNMTGGSPIVSQPFDVDGSPGAFGPAELELIRRVWQRVAEDFAPFAVNVTTEDPGIEALRKSSAGDASFGVRVVISPTNWYSASGAGVGYVGSFDWSSDTPCFAFTGLLANNEKNIAECASHEVGHTFGLYHDGLSGAAATEYYLGHGDWAPIMGAGYYRAVTQFSRGEYANASRNQDDLAVIATFVPYATDDHGAALATATVLSGPAVATGGTIEQATDVDLFRFSTASGSISFRVQGPSIQPNLDVHAELLDASGQVLQSVNPGSLDAYINATLAAGTYYLRIAGVGAGDPINTGYSNYGSIGNYVITGTLATATANQPPVAVATASVTSGPAPLTVTFSSQGSSDPDGSITSYHWDLGTGATSREPSPTYSYINSGTFTVTLTVTDNAMLTHSASIALDIGSGASAVAPAITTQPASQVAAPGTSVSFTIAATGTPTPTVRWYRSGLTWAGWTGSTLTLPGVTTNDNGIYTAVVTNSVGSITSDPATLDVTAAAPSAVAPTITMHPSSQTVAAGSSVTFSGAASGSPAPTYQWNKDGVALAGGTSPMLTVNAVTTADEGSYTLVATNSAGSATSGVAVLSVTAATGNIAPTIVTQPQSRTAAWGGSVTFTVVATGTPAPTVRWYRNGMTWDGWAGGSLTLPSLTSNDNGTYTAVVTNSAGSVTSAPATLTVQ